MTHPDLAYLETQVCRAVASLAASSRRKRFIREELLAHMADAFEQEIDRHGDSQLAAEAVERRFGDTGDLREQLQASVPFVESMFFSYFGEKEKLMSRWWIVGVVVLLICSAVFLPESAEFMLGALAMLGIVGVVRFSQTNNAVSRALRPLWGLIVGCVAVLFGPALILPALAKLKQHANEVAGAVGPHLFKEELLGPLVLGTLITIGGLSLIAYSVSKNLLAERA